MEGSILKNQSDLALIRRHDSVSGVKYISNDWDATVYLYASRRNASTWDFRISI